VDEDRIQTKCEKTVGEHLIADHGPKTRCRGRLTGGVQPPAARPRLSCASHIRDRDTAVLRAELHLAAGVCCDAHRVRAVGADEIAQSFDRLFGCPDAIERQKGAVDVHDQVCSDRSQARELFDPRDGYAPDPAHYASDLGRHLAGHREA
jgi:hypothetical protein